MKLAVISSRSIDDKEAVKRIVKDYLEEHSHDRVTFLTGSALGTDEYVKEFANEKGYDTVSFVPYHLVDNATEFSSKFFFFRTKQLLDQADALIALWDSESNGTKYAIRYAQKRNIPVKVIKEK